MKTNPIITARLAAGMAISNMGQEVPAYISDRPKNWSPSVEYTVCDLAGHIMETDEHEDIFVGEAKGWLKYIRKEGYANLLKNHGPHCPWIAKVLEAAKELS